MKEGCRAGLAAAIAEPNVAEYVNLIVFLHLFSWLRSHCVNVSQWGSIAVVCPAHFLVGEA